MLTARIRPRTAPRTSGPDDLAGVSRRTPRDRPPYVRAGSGLAWWGGHLALVQDDARFVALVDPATHHVEALALPRGEGGARVFGEDRGTKHLKLDLEAVATIESGALMVALGSGSSDRRQTVAFLREGEPPVLVEARALYAALRETKAFAGSELNVEGAFVVPSADGPRLRLFNRGNGAPRDGRAPVNATADLDVVALLAYLGAPDREPPPLLDVTPFVLGRLDGPRLGFTDAALDSDGRVLVAMAAEDSPDATRDGRVAGSALGVVDEEDGRAVRLRWTPLRTTTDTLFSGKVEGLALDPRQPERAYLAVDADDPAQPSMLCVADLDGPW